MIIVTGGAGFIGSAIVWRLNKMGRSDIIIVDHLGKTEKWKNLVPLKYSDYFEKDDFLKMIQENKLNYLVNLDAVIHMGACSATTELDASYLMRNNFEYSKVLAKFAIERKARFIYASSAATYGDGSYGFSDDENELDKLRPLNMYGYSKQMFDLWAKQEGVLREAVGLKFFNVFGPNEYHKGEMRSVVSKAFEQVKSTGIIKLFKSYRPDYKDGEQRRDFIYIKDAVEMVVFFFENRNVNGIYNVGSGEANTWNDLAYAIFRSMQIEPRIEYVEMPQTIREKYQYYTCAVVSKIKSSGYTGRNTPLQQGVEDYIKNYLLPGKHLGE